MPSTILNLQSRCNRLVAFFVTIIKVVLESQKDELTSSSKYLWLVVTFITFFVYLSIKSRFTVEKGLAWPQFYLFLD